MPYGYIGQNTPNQTKSNSGVFSISDVADLEKQGKFGGSLELIEHQTYSSAVANIDFTSIKENKYNVHLLQGSFSFGTADLVGIRFYESGVLETASVYKVSRIFGRSDSTQGEARSDAVSDIFIGESSTLHQNMNVYISNAGDSAKYTYTNQLITTYDDTGASRYFYSFGSGVLPQTSTVNGIRIFGRVSGNNFDDFNVKLFGVKRFMSALRLINETSATSVSSLDVTDVFTSEFDIYKITYTMSDNSVGEAIDLRVINSSGSVISSLDYNFARQLMLSNTSASEQRSTSFDKMRGMGEATEQGSGNVIYMFNPYSSNTYTLALGQSVGMYGTELIAFKWQSSYRDTVSIRGFRLFTSTGTVLDTINAKTYGLRVDS